MEKCGFANILIAFFLSACLPSLAPIATRISDKSKHLREGKNTQKISPALLTNPSPLGKAPFDVPSSTGSSSDDRHSQTLDLSFDVEKGAEALRSETNAAVRPLSELE